MIPLAVLITTRNEELNIGDCLKSLEGLTDEIFVLDSESTDRTREIAEGLGARVVNLAYDHSRIIPWIFQWGLDHLPLSKEWVLILEADQRLSTGMRQELEALLDGHPVSENGFFIRKRQLFRGRVLRHGGYGSKYLLKLFRRGCGQLDVREQDTRVYVTGKVGHLKSDLHEDNAKENRILFYLEKHLRYADAFAREELDRRKHGFQWKTKPRLFGNADERVLWLKQRYYSFPLYWRSIGYFLYRFFIRLGFLDGKEGFTFHFLQAFWFRWVVDVRLEELMREESAAGSHVGAGALKEGERLP